MLFFDSLGFAGFEFSKTMPTFVSEVAAEVVNDCANHVAPDAVAHALSDGSQVKRLKVASLEGFVPASARPPGALSPAKVAMVMTIITRTAASGLTRIPRSLISRIFT